MTKISQLPQLADSGLGPDMFFPTVADGTTQKMTSDQLRNLCRPGFYFPADPSLTLADAGKIVVNSNGKAKVAMTDTALPGTAGRWDIKAGMLIASPKQAAYTLGLMSNPVANDSFTLFGDIWTFVSGLPSAPFQIQLGANNTDTMANLRSTLNTYGSANNYYSLTYITDATGHLAVGSHFPGLASTTPGFSTTNSALYSSPIQTGYDGDYFNLEQIILEWQKNGNTYSIKLKDVCSHSAPAGQSILGYRWPSTTTEQEQNLEYALNQNTDFTDHFSIVNLSGSLQATETVPPVTQAADITATGSYYSVTEAEPSTSGTGHYVGDVVLGLLLYIHEDNALISTDRIFQAKLSSDSAPVAFGTTPSQPFNRILMYADNGAVFGPVPFDDHMDPNFFGNGFVLALEEGNPGDKIWVQAIFFPGGG